MFLTAPVIQFAMLTIQDWQMLWIDEIFFQSYCYDLLYRLLIPYLLTGGITVALAMGKKADAQFEKIDILLWAGFILCYYVMNASSMNGVMTRFNSIKEAAYYGSYSFRFMEFTDYWPGIAFAVMLFVRSGHFHFTWKKYCVFSAVFLLGSIVLMLSCGFLFIFMWMRRLTELVFAVRLGQKERRKSSILLILTMFFGVIIHVIVAGFIKSPEIYWPIDEYFPFILALFASNITALKQWYRNRRCAIIK